MKILVYMNGNIRYTMSVPDHQADTLNRTLFGDDARVLTPEQNAAELLLLRTPTVNTTPF